MKVFLLAAIQFVPLLYFLIKRERALLAVHLLGLFLFTTWKKFFIRYRDIDPVGHLLIATLLLFVGYFVVQFFLTKKKTATREIVIPDTWIPSLAFTLLVTHFSIFNSGGTAVLVLTLQFLLATALVLHRGQFEWGSQIVVALYVGTAFIVRENTLTGLELVLASALGAYLQRSWRGIVFAASLATLVLCLEIIKPTYRSHIDREIQMSFLERTKVFFYIVRKLPENRIALFKPGRLPSAYGDSSSKPEQLPALTTMRIRRTVFPKQIGYEGLAIFGMENSYFELLNQSISILSAPTGVLNPLIIIDLAPPEKGKYVKEGVVRSFRRIGDDSLERVLQFTPHLVPYAEPKSYSALLTLFVPRFLWPNKPSHNIWNEFGRRYYLIQSTDDQTSIAFTYLTEGFMTFGRIGLLGAALGLGLLLGLLDRRGHPILLTVILASAFAAPADSFSMLSKLLHRAGLFLIFVWCFKRRERNRRGPKEEYTTKPVSKNYHPQELEIIQP